MVSDNDDNGPDLGHEDTPGGDFDTVAQLEKTQQDSNWIKKLHLLPVKNVVVLRAGRTTADIVRKFGTFLDLSVFFQGLSADLSEAKLVMLRPL
jgi:hypothetical protein